MVEEQAILKGVFSAVLTPLADDLAPDPRKAIPYYRELLAQGCDGLVLLGTTGEGMSFSVDQRLRFMEAIAASDFPRGRIMVGTGAAALADCVRLTRATFELGFAATLVMPPFYFRGIGDDGIVAFFDRLFNATRAPKRGVILYNFPAMSGITFTLELVERLVREFPGMIAGIKDSSNDTELQRSILARVPDFAVFPGSDEMLAQAKKDGLAGCISGSVCLWSELAANVWRGGDPAAAQRLGDLNRALRGMPMIPAVRYLTAKKLRDDAWLKSVPPLEALSDSAAAALLASVV